VIRHHEAALAWLRPYWRSRPLLLAWARAAVRRGDGARFRASYAGVFGDAVDQISVDGGGLGIRSVSANAKVAVMPLPVVRPYVTGGIGLAWLSVDQARTSIADVPGNTFPANTQNGKQSFNLGAGVDLELGIRLFAEARYVWILTEGERSTYVPVAIGVTF
jgi:opacity protein-like surface antigen